MKTLIHNSPSNSLNRLFVYLISATMFLTYNTMSAQKKDMMVRLSEIEIYLDVKTRFKSF